MIDTDWIAERLNQLPYDIRVEVIAADLLDNGLPEEQLVIKPLSLFKRRFARDIHQVRTVETNSKEDDLYIEITRDGIYDLLPEGFFHQPKDRKHYKNLSEMVFDVKTHRVEEQNARQFFLPIENEIFHSRVAVEQAEKAIFYELENNGFNDFLIDFWKLNEYKDYKAVNLLVRFLPILYRLSNQIELIKICYELLLRVPVEIEIIFDGKSQPTNNTGWQLGKGFSGFTTIFGNSIPNDLPAYYVYLGPLNDKQLSAFLPSGNMYKFVELLNSYFLPAGYEKNIVALPSLNNNSVDLSNENLILGMNSYIN